MTALAILAPAAKGRLETASFAARLPSGRPPPPRHAARSAADAATTPAPAPRLPRRRATAPQWPPWPRCRPNPAGRPSRSSPPAPASACPQPGRPCSPTRRTAPPPGSRAVARHRRHLDACRAAGSASPTPQRDLAAQGRRAVKAAASGRRPRRPGPARCATRSRSTCASSRHGLHPAPGRQGADPVGRGGRQCPGQAGQPRCRADGHRQAAHLPARRRRLGIRPGRGRRPRRQRGGRVQRRVTRPAPARPGRQQDAVPAARSALVPAVYPGWTRARPARTTRRV